MIFVNSIYSHHPIRLADHVYVGPNSVVSAGLIGSHVYIGKDCVLQPFCIIKDCVKSLDGTVIPAGMVVPGFSIVAGRPGRVVGELGEGWGMGGAGDEGDMRERYRTVGN